MEATPFVTNPNLYVDIQHKKNTKFIGMLKNQSSRNPEQVT